MLMDDGYRRPRDEGPTWGLEELLWRRIAAPFLKHLEGT
jgi:hypothetical protein